MEAVGLVNAGCSSSGLELASRYTSSGVSAVGVVVGLTRSRSSESFRGYLSRRARVHRVVELRPAVVKRSSHELRALVLSGSNIRRCSGAGCARMALGWTPSEEGCR